MTEAREQGAIPTSGGVGEAAPPPAARRRRRARRRRPIASETRTEVPRLNLVRGYLRTIRGR